MIYVKSLVEVELFKQFTSLIYSLILIDVFDVN